MYTPETKEQSKQWALPDERAPRKMKTVLTAEKVMTTVYWDSEGVIYIAYLEKDKTVTGLWATPTLHITRKRILQKVQISWSLAGSRVLRLREIVLRRKSPFSQNVRFSFGSYVLIALPSYDFYRNKIKWNSNATHQQCNQLLGYLEMLPHNLSLIKNV